MIAVKDAIQKAREFFRNVKEQDNPRNVQLEEVDQSEDGQYWLITLGYDAAYREIGPVMGQDFFTGKRQIASIPREYKILKIARDTGDVLAMNNRLP